MRYALAVLMILISMTSSAYAYSGGNVVKQSVNMYAEGGYVSQSASNAAVLMGDNNYLDQSITQSGSGNYVTQSAANAAVVVGDNNTVAQGVAQSGTGNTVVQSGANAVAVVGSDNYVDQEVAQTAVGNEIYQSGWNTGTIIGDGNVLAQSVLAYAENMPQAVDPTQSMSNLAYVMGSYNQVNQDIAGYVMFGASNAPVNQEASNYIQAYDMVGNVYDQGIGFRVRAGPQANVMQSAQNQVKIGPW